MILCSDEALVALFNPQNYYRNQPLLTTVRKPIVSMVIGKFKTITRQTYSINRSSISVRCWSRKEQHMGSKGLCQPGKGNYHQSEGRGFTPIWFISLSLAPCWQATLYILFPSGYKQWSWLRAWLCYSVLASPGRVHTGQESTHNPTQIKQ